VSDRISSRTRRAPHRRRLALAGLVLVAAVTGCESQDWAGYAATAAAGWLVGRLTTPVDIETRCYRDGVEVDCATLPTY
jgi:hypothetical protein